MRNTFGRPAPRAAPPAGRRTAGRRDRRPAPLGEGLVRGTTQAAPGDVAVERPDRPADVRKAEAVEVGISRAGRVDFDDRLGDRLEVGTEVPAGFDHKQRFALRLDASNPKVP